MNCPAKVTIDYGAGPIVCACTAPQDHAGHHEATYKPLDDGITLELSWLDLPAPSLCPAPGKGSKRQAGPEQEPFRSKHYPVKKV